MTKLSGVIPKDTRDIRRIKAVGLELSPTLRNLERLDENTTYTADELRDKFNELLDALREKK